VIARAMRALLLLLVACLVASPLFAAHQDRHVILVTIDGFPARHWRDPMMPLPVLRQLAAAGASADAMTVSNPSITWPTHTTLVTGVTPQKHGVLFNGLLVRQGPGKPPKIEPWVDKSRLVRVPTVYDRAHAAGLTTAESDWVAVTRPGTITWSFGEVPNPDGPVEKEMIAAGLLTAEDLRAMQPGGGRKTTLWRDNIWTRAAIYMLKQHKPNLLLYHTLNTDGIHHRYGPDTDPGYTALAYADRLLGDLVRAVDEAGLRAKTTFIITTDHGFKKVTQFAYPNVVLKQAGLVKAAGPTVTHCDAYTMTQGGIAFVYILDPARRAELLPRLKQLFATADGVERVLDAREGAHSLGMPTPDENQGMGELILYPKAGYSFSAAVTGDATSGPSVNYGGSHGYPNTDHELDGLFVASGAGIRPGTRVERVRNFDVAPTIARLLGLDLGPVDGRALEEILVPTR
jgi:predicted AlkP superfamily pyrophosphatase or phosphodiesterase